MTTTASTHRRGGWLVLLLAAVLTAALAVLLAVLLAATNAGIASAATVSTGGSSSAVSSSAAGTRVGVSSSDSILIVGVGDHIAAGQGRGEASSQCQLVSGCCVAAEDGITYGAHDVGPLPESVANTFRGGSYTERTLQSETTLYRVYGGEAGPVGSYWSRTAPSGALQAQLDGAINPAWGNTIERVATARVPAGTTIYEGAAGEQGLAGGGSLLGGGNQVYIPNVDPSWVTP